ncbi:RICIN domain-containing protein [Streptomyces sp. AC512_CC834]|nr:RICIN domain-containing protein [Streptomyces sp. AC512_CC834]
MCTVINRHNGKVWDVDGGSGATADGARLSRRSCSQSAAQTFTLTTG